jgi:hypothetical protein
MRICSGGLDDKGHVVQCPEVPLLSQPRLRHNMHRLQALLENIGDRRVTPPFRKVLLAAPVLATYRQNRYFSTLISPRIIDSSAYLLLFQHLPDYWSRNSSIADAFASLFVNYCHNRLHHCCLRRNLKCKYLHSRFFDPF